MVKEIKDKKWYQKWWAITLFVIVAIMLIGNLFGDSSTTNASSYEKKIDSIVKTTQSYKYYSYVYDSGLNLTKYNGTYTNAWFANQTYVDWLRSYCGDVEFPSNILMGVQKGTMLILNAETNEVVCDYVADWLKEDYTKKIEQENQEKLIAELNKFPKLSEDDKYKITLESLYKNKIGDTIWLDTSFKSENKRTGEIMPDYSSGLSFEDCMSYSVYLLDFQTNAYFTIRDTVSRCGRSVRYSEKKYTLENGTIIYLKDINRPMKLVITTYRPVSTNRESFFNEVKRGYGDDLYIFDVDVYNLPVK